MIQFAFIAVCALLWRLGGWEKAKWSGYRDVLVPVALGLWYAFTAAWWMFFVVGGLTNIIRMGYGSYDPEHDDKPSWLASITHDREGWIIRGIYGFITSFMIGVVPAIFYAHPYKFCMYVLGNTVLEMLLTKLKVVDFVHEPLAGAARASIILLCR